MNIILIRATREILARDNLLSIRIHILFDHIENTLLECFQIFSVDLLIALGVLVNALNLILIGIELPENRVFQCQLIPTGQDHAAINLTQRRKILALIDLLLDRRNDDLFHNLMRERRHLILFGRCHLRRILLTCQIIFLHHDLQMVLKDINCITLLINLSLVGRDPHFIECVCLNLCGAEFCISLRINAIPELLAQIRVGIS